MPNFSFLGWFSFLSAVKQLLTAFDSWWQLSQKKVKWDFHLLPKADTFAKFQLSRLLGGLARECYRQTDRRTDRQTDGRQVKIMLTQPCIDGARAWVGQLRVSAPPSELSWSYLVLVQKFVELRIQNSTPPPFSDSYNSLMNVNIPQNFVWNCLPWHWHLIIYQSSLQIIAQIKPWNQPGRSYVSPIFIG